MSYIIIGAIVIVIILLLNKFDNWTFSLKSRQKVLDSEILKVLLNLNEDSLNQLFQLYKESFGKGAAYYARRTYHKWKDGKVRPNNQTFQRFLLYLPKVMSYDLKCEILRHFMKEYSVKENHQLTVYTDDWETALTPLVQQLIEKPYQAELPNEVKEKLTWLAEGEMLVAKEILRQSQIEEGKIAVSMLFQEFCNIEKLLGETHLKPKVTHQLKFPSGTITLNIKRRL